MKTSPNHPVLRVGRLRLPMSACLLAVGLILLSLPIVQRTRAAGSAAKPRPSVLAARFQANPETVTKSGVAGATPRSGIGTTTINYGLLSSLPLTNLTLNDTWSSGQTLVAASVQTVTGSYNVGAGQTYTSLTQPGGIFEFINNNVVTGNVTINITSDLTGENGAVALNQFASGFTMLIKPSGGARSITGSNASAAIIRLNGTENVTIDGSTAATLAGGNPALRELTITNTDAGGSGVGVEIGSGSSGAANNQLKNLIVKGSGPTTSLFGVSIQGFDNDNNRIENCAIQRAYYGIFAFGQDQSNKDIGTVITANDLASTGADRIGQVGILVYHQDGVEISDNTVGGIDSDIAAYAVGIGVGIEDPVVGSQIGGGIVNATVARNKVNGVSHTNSFTAAGIAIAGDPGGANTIVNNMVSGVISNATDPSIVAGIFVTGNDANTKVLNNSVSMTGDRGAAFSNQYPSYALAITTGGGDPVVQLRNNILYNTQTTDLVASPQAKSYAIGTSSTTFVNYDSTFNDFWSTGANDGGFRSGGLAGGLGTDDATLALWQGRTGDEAGSIEANPLFVNAANNLHIPTTSPAWNTGVTIAAVTNDFDGDARPLNSVYEIGADEVFAAPEMNVQGNSQNIVDGDATPDLADHTDFGSAATLGGTVVRTFTILNSGAGDLNLTGSPRVVVGGTHMGDFTVSVQPNSPVAPAGSTTFQVTFDPSAPGLRSATLSIDNNDADENPYNFSIEGTGIQPDYSVTTTGNAIVVTDLSGNTDTMDVVQPVNGQIRFDVSGRIFQVDGGGFSVGTSGNLSLTGINSITVNAQAGNDVFNVSGFASLPSLTVNGGTGDDFVNFNGNITFKADANLDLDLQNDDASPGIDTAVFNNADLLLSGTGTAVVRVSRNIAFGTGSTLQTVNGNIVVEANQQATSPGTFFGVDVNDATITATGTGTVTVKGKGGTGPAGEYGVYVHGATGLIKGGNVSGSTTTTVVGTGGIGTQSSNGGVVVSGTISSFGGDVTVTGTGGSNIAGTSNDNHGVFPVTTGLITSGGNGNVTVFGTGGGGSNGQNVGVLTQTATITSGGTGTVSVTGTGGAGGGSHGVWVYEDAIINSGGTGTVTVTGTGGGTSGHGVYMTRTAAGTALRINSGGGAIMVTGTPAGGTGIFVNPTAPGLAAIASTGNAAVNLVADTINLDAANASVSAGSGTVNLRQLTNGKTINLGGADSGTQLGLTDAELDRVSAAGTLQIGDANTGAVQVSAVITQTKTTNIFSTGTTVLNLGSLGIFGTVNSTLTNNSGGTVRPGASPGVINSGNLNLAGGSATAIEIGGTIPGNTATNHDQLNVTGTVTLGGTLSVSNFGGFAPVVGQQYTIVNNDGGDAVSGQFTGLSEGASVPITGSGRSASISYAGGDSNDVVLTVQAAPGTVQFSSATYSDSEGAGSIVLTVTRTGGSDGAVTVNYSFADVTATGVSGCGPPPADYNNASTNVIFADGDSANKTINVSICNDDTDEPDEAFTSTLSIGSGSATLGTPSTTTVTIQDDDDPPTIAINNVSQAEGNSGTSNFTFNVTLSNPSSGTVTVDYATANGTTNPATGGVTCGSGNDYLADSGGVIFLPGSVSEQVTISVCGDTDLETDETFLVNLSNNSANSTLPGGTAGTGTIQNDECTPAPSGMTLWHKAEGNFNDSVGANNGVQNGGVGFVSGKVNQAYTFDGSDDFVQVSDHASLNSTTGTWDFWIKTSQPGNNAGVMAKANSSTNEGVTMILNPAGSIGVSFNGVSQVGGLAGTAPVNNGQWHHVAVTFQAGGTANLYIDGALNDSQAAGAFTFGPYALRLGRVADAFWATFGGQLDEVEVFNTVLTQPQIQAIYNASGGGKCQACTAPPLNMTQWYDGSGSSPTANDIGGDRPGTMNGATFAPGKVGQGFSFSGSNQYITMADSPSWDLGTADFTIDAWINTPNATGVQRILSAGIESDGANQLWALGYGDLGAWGGGTRLNFAYWHGSGYVDFNSNAITLTPNQWHHVAAVRSGSTFTFYLNGAAVGGGNIGAVAVNGGNAGGMIGARRNTTFDIYEFANGRLDEIELFNRALTAAEIDRIYDADYAGKCHTSILRFATATDTVGEAAGPATFNVVRDGANDSATTVNYTFADAGATGGGACGGTVDYVNTGGTASFAIGESAKSFTTGICNDATNEASEAFTSTLSGATGSATVGTPSVETMTILDNDADPTFTISNVSQAETNSGITNFVFDVTKVGTTSQNVSVSFATGDVTAMGATCGAVGVDYGGLSGNTIFAPADTVKQITIGVCGDTFVEPNETFTVTLTSQTVGGGSPTPINVVGTGTITNDDVPPTTLVVNTTNDVDDGICDGTHCSLREAINASNFSSDANTINFNIPNTDPGFVGGVFTIQPTSVYDFITKPVTIDGASQTIFTGDTNVNGPEVVINGSLAGAGASGLFISGDNSTIKDLVINGFSGTGLIISYNVDASPTGNQLLNNYVGTDASGTVAVPNGGGGISLGSNLAGSNTISGNLVSGNSFVGINTCDASNSTFSNNKIGTDRTGTSNLGNGGPGIHFQCSTGRNNTISGNTIAFNTTDGFRDEPDYRFGATPHFNNRLTQNSIFSNGGLGINLNPPPFGTIDGVTPNDAGDPDTGGNNLQNFPIITSATTNGTQVNIQGTLNSTASATFDLEFFANSSCDGSGNGEGQTYIGTTNVMTNGSGDATFNVTFSASVSAGQSITATATDASGNTSEFSACASPTVLELSGTISYCNDPTKKVPNATVATTSGSPSATTTTNASGFYQLNNLGFGPYTVTPSKTGGVASNTISAFDAALVAQYVAGPPFPVPTACQSLAGDASNDGALSAFDAAFIAQTVAGISNPGFAGTWKFVPSSRSYPSIGNLPNENYDAVLVGDVSGNWTPAGPERPIGAPTGGANVAVALPNQTAGPGSTNVMVPVIVGDTTGQGIIAYDFTFTFNTSVIQLTSPPVFITDNTLSEGWTITPNTSTPGQIRIVAFNTVALSGQGTLINIRFNVVGSQGTMTPLTWTNFVFNEDPPTTNNLTNGSFTVSGPTDIQLAGFTAESFGGDASDKGGVLLEWKTEFEVANLGFNIYREESGARTQVNPGLIAGSALFVGGSTSLTAGRSYAWHDTQSGSGADAMYWLEEIDLNGHSTWHGPVRATASVGKQSSTIVTDSKTIGEVSQDSASLGTTTPVERRDLASLASSGAQAVSGLPGQLAAKLSIKREGWYRVSQPDLVAAGINAATDPRLLQMYVDGVEQPINVVGEGDGRFDATDAVEFYGIGADTPSTDTRAYWLVAGAQAGRRIQQSGSHGGLPAGGGFSYTVERKDRTVYFSALRNGERENFFGALIAGGAVDQTLTIAHVDRAGEQAELEVALQGVTLVPHRVSVQINGENAGQVLFDNQTEGTAKLTVSHSLLREGPNTVTLTAQGGQNDISLVSFIRLTYQHSYAADNDALSFSATGNQEVTVVGFSSNQIRVMDVTDLAKVQEVTGSVKQVKSGYGVTITVPGAGSRSLIAFAGNQVSAPASVIANQPSSLRQAANGTDLLIITRQEFISSLNPLVTLRQSQKLAVKVVDVEDIYDEFNFGQKSPEAVKSFLSYTKTSWKRKPQYVLFAGDSSFDPRNYLGQGSFDLVPSKFVDTTYMETASDDYLADFNGDGLADLSVGRLPFRTPQDAAAIVSKIVGYEKKGSAPSVLLIADISDGYNFGEANDQLKGLIPGNLRVRDVRRGDQDDATTRKLLLDGINQGQKVVNYTGHGSVTVWRGNILTADEVATMNNADRLPLFVTMTCLNGYFQDPILDSLAESLLKAEGGGAIAVWASSGMTLPGDQAVMNQQMFRLLFGGSGQRLGDVTARAKAATQNGDVRRTWILFGDPTMKLK